MSVETKQLNCINCPLGCLLTVTLEDGKITKVTGNTCPRGEKYAHQELTDPQRMLTSNCRSCRSYPRRRCRKAKSSTVQQPCAASKSKPRSIQATSSSKISWASA
jgi:CxxC motif-containing protein